MIFPVIDRSEVPLFFPDLILKEGYHCGIFEFLWHDFLIPEVGQDAAQTLTLTLNVQSISRLATLKISAGMPCMLAVLYHCYSDLLPSLLPPGLGAGQYHSMQASVEWNPKLRGQLYQINQINVP